MQSQLAVLLVLRGLCNFRGIHKRWRAVSDLVLEKKPSPYHPRPPPKKKAQEEGAAVAAEKQWKASRINIL